MKISLGDHVKDAITGMEGIAVARVDYLTGCTQICISPKVDKDGKLQDSHYVDESRLVRTNMKGFVPPADEVAAHPGCDNHPDRPRT